MGGLVLVKMASLRQRAPMLELEFHGTLFQFDEREPQFAPLSQLPLSSSSLRALHSPDPAPEHAPDFRDMDCGRLVLMLRYESALGRGAEAQNKTERSEAGVCGIKPRDLAGFPRFDKQIDLAQHEPECVVAGDVVGPTQPDEYRVGVVNEVLVSLHDGELIHALVWRWISFS
jgi:hypothetical protein